MKKLFFLTVPQDLWCRRLIETGNCLIIIIFTFFSTFNLNAQPGQVSLTIQQEANPSLFLEDHLKISFLFNPADSIYIDRNKCCTVEFKLPGKEWNELSPYFIVEDECDGCYILLDTLERQEDIYRARLVATDSATLSQLAVMPVPIALRYRINAIQNNTPLTLYSNIDTMFLPVAVPDDIGVIKFLSNKGLNALQFVYSRTLAIRQNYDYIAYIRDSYPASLLSEFADYALIKYNFSEDARQAPLTTDQILFYKTKFQSFLNSASPDLREFAQWKLKNALFNQ